MLNIKYKSSGFTLIELLLVISIVLIIGTFSAVFYTRFLTQNAVANTQDQLIGQLRKAQIYSMISKYSNTWGVHYESNTITLFNGVSYASRNQVLDEKFTVNPNISIEYVPSPIVDIIFSRMTGIPSWSGTITITGNSDPKTITINSQGVTSR